MKFSELKLLLKDSSYQKFEQQIQKQPIPVQDYTLLLRQAIKINLDQFEKFFKLLLKKNADINFADTHQHISNLMMACKNGNLKIVQLLSEHPNIDFQKKDGKKLTAAFYAIQCKIKDGQQCLKIILDKKPALINQQANNKSLLIQAIEKSKLEIVKLLLRSGADPNFIIADSGNTPLHEAVKQYKLKKIKILEEMMKQLIQFNANPKLKNKKGKDVFEFAQNCSETLKQIISQAKIRPLDQLQNITNIPLTSYNNPERIQRMQPQVRKSLVINTKSDEQRIFNQAKNIYNDYKYMTQFVYEMSDSEQEEADQTQDNQPYINQDNTMVEKLSEEMQRFSQTCQQNYLNVKIDMQGFLDKMRKIANRHEMNMEVYGSFSTGLWLKNCDIDILLIPKMDYYENQQAQQNNNYNSYVIDNLEKVYQIIRKEYPENCIINRNIKVPMIRFQVPANSQHKPRKIDITVQDPNHNGIQNSNYIRQQIKYYPQLKPLFFVIKSLTYHYKLNDPKKGGIRTYAIIIMILSFLEKMQCKQKNYPLGQLLLKFLEFFGFEYQYDYGYFPMIQNNAQGQANEYNNIPSMILVIWDPLNRNNNVGKNARAYELQCMFKAAYIALHTKRDGDMIPFILETKRIMFPL